MAVRILAGPRGAGKTSFLRAYVAGAVDRGRSVGGIVSPVVFENGRRIGYDLIDLRHGRRRQLARAVGSDVANPDVGMFGFDAGAVVEGQRY